MRLLAVADSDSYLKWAVATARVMPDAWDVDVVVLRNPIAPSPEQARGAAGSELPVVGLRRLSRLVATSEPDALLLACTGPVVELLTARLRTGTGRRPVLVTGLPGVAVPASARAVVYRRECDLFLVHSRRERDEFRALAAQLAPAMTIGLAHLAFLPKPQGAPPRSAGQSGDVVFAPQAKVPVSRADRERILVALATRSRRQGVVVKLRARAGELQTHHEQMPYPELWEGLLAAGRVPAANVRFTTTPMAETLRGAAGLVTVSSTAALEAMAVGVGVLALTDFGIGPDLVNPVFVGSGCQGTLEDLQAGRFFRPRSRWLLDNYFHPEVEDDWLRELSGLVERGRGQGLPSVTAVSRLRRLPLVRQRVRLLLPAAARRLGQRPWLRARAWLTSRTWRR
jgi:hypothetical protein